MEKHIEYTIELQNIVIEQIKSMSKDLDDKFTNLEAINMENFSDLYRKISKIGCTLFETREEVKNKSINKNCVLIKNRIEKN